MDVLYKSVARLLNATSWLSITTSIYTFTVISILRFLTIMKNPSQEITLSFDPSRLLYHNYSTFYSDHFEARVVKSEGRVSWMTLSILIPWLLGLIQENQFF